MGSIQNVTAITATDLREGVLKKELPEYYALKNYRENSLWHRHEESVFEHVVKVYERVEELLDFSFARDESKKKLREYFSFKMGSKSREELLRIATLLHDIAKGETLIMKQDGTTASPFHEIVGGEMVADFKKRFGLSNEEYEFVRKIVLYHDVMHNYLSLSASEPESQKVLMPLLKRMLGDAFIATALMVYADMQGSDVPKTDPDEYEARSRKAVEILNGDWVWE